MKMKSEETAGIVSMTPPSVLLQELKVRTAKSSDLVVIQRAKSSDLCKGNRGSEQQGGAFPL